MKDVFLVIGANGQLGSILTLALREQYGTKQVIASDITKHKTFLGTFETIDATDRFQIQQVVRKYKVTQIFHLAAILSAKGETHPLKTWEINMTTFLNVLEVARTNGVKKVFYPSSIAVFGSEAAQIKTPNNACLNPNTVYGISKVSGEIWAQYYHEKYKLDVRSIRYPGVIGHQSLPGGGTTDYAVSIFHKAVLGEPFACYLGANTSLPMIYIEDAIRATLELMEAPQEAIKIRTAYNIAGLSFSPKEVALAIQERIPSFKITYAPDFRDKIAQNWPQSIDDTAAKQDWGWLPRYNLSQITDTMLHALTAYYTNPLKTNKDRSILCI